jgi:hypothetical protein
VHGVHHVVESGIEELLGSFGIEAADELRRVFEVGKQHGDPLAFAFQGTLRGQDLLGEIRRGIRPWSTRLVCGQGRSWRRSRTGCSGPDQAMAVVLDRVGVGIEKFVLEILEGVIIQVELPFEHAIGHAASPLEQGSRVIQNLLEGHRRPSIALALAPRKGNVCHARVYQESAPRLYQQDGRVAAEITLLGRGRGLGA